MDQGGNAERGLRRRGSGHRGHRAAELGRPRRRHRHVGYNSDGTGKHDGRHSETFNQGFFQECDSWAENLNFFAENY